MSRGVDVSIEVGQLGKYVPSHQGAVNAFNSTFYMGMDFPVTSLDRRPSTLKHTRVLSNKKTPLDDLRLQPLPGNVFPKGYLSCIVKQEKHLLTTCVSNLCPGMYFPKGIWFTLPDSLSERTSLDGECPLIGECISRSHIFGICLKI